MKSKGRPGRRRLPDFLARATPKARTAAPASSYRLGVREAPCHDLLPAPLAETIATAAAENFEKAMPGFVCDDALLHGVETRTSAPVRVPRDAETLASPDVAGLYPCGEGAGYAGGIVSSAVDGLRVARAVAAAAGVAAGDVAAS